MSSSRISDGLFTPVAQLRTDPSTYGIYTSSTDLLGGYAAPRG